MEKYGISPSMTNSFKFAQDFSGFNAGKPLIPGQTGMAGHPRETEELTGKGS